MSTVKTDVITAVSTNGDLSLDGLGTGGVSIASTLKMTKGGDIASASPLVIDTDGNYFDVTGTTNFAAMTVEAGNFFMLQFDGALTITHGSGIELPGAANLTTAAGDRLICYATAANTVEVMNVATEAAAAGGATDINGLSDAITKDSGKTIGLGTGALANDDGNDRKNTAVGYNSLNTVTTGDSNIAFGYNALANNTTGYSNLAVGYQALYDCTTAVINAAVGYNALANDTTGRNNYAFGHSALINLTTGERNVAMGGNALGQVTTGEDNTAIGNYAGYIITTGNNNTSLGYYASPSANNSINQVTLGNASVSSIRCQVQSISSLSDRRDKKDIKELPVGLDFINDLKPVKFVWDMRDGAKKGVQEIGFVAQDLDESQINAGAEDYLNLVLKDNPDKLEASYGKLVPILVKAVQELSAEVNHLKEKLNT